MPDLAANIEISDPPKRCKPYVGYGTIPFLRRARAHTLVWEVVQMALLTEEQPKRKFQPMSCSAHSSNVIAIPCTVLCLRFSFQNFPYGNCSVQNKRKCSAVYQICHEMLFLKFVIRLCTIFNYIYISFSVTTFASGLPSSRHVSHFILRMYLNLFTVYIPPGRHRNICYI